MILTLPSCRDGACFRVSNCLHTSRASCHLVEMVHVSGFQTVCTPQGQVAHLKGKLHTSREGYAVASSSVGAKTDVALAKCIMQGSTCDWSKF